MPTSPTPAAYKVARMLPEEYALYDAKEAVRRETRAYEQRVQEAQRALDGAQGAHVRRIPTTRASVSRPHPVGRAALWSAWSGRTTPPAPNGD
jgi:hypothetical protein